MIRPSCLAAAGLAAMAAAIALPASATVLYSTNFASPSFSTGALAGQAGWGVVSTQPNEVTVQDTVTDGGEPAVNLGQSAATVYYQYGPLTPTDPIVVSMDIDEDAPGFSGLTFAVISSAGVFDDNPNDDRAAGVEINGGLRAIPTSSATLAPLSTGVWYDLSMTLDYATQTYDIAVDGSIVATNIPFCGYESDSATCTGAQASQFEGVEVWTAGVKSGAVYFGDVSIVELPEPSAWTMMLAGFAFAGLCLRSRRRLAA
jgi:hypothetical protein